MLALVQVLNITSGATATGVGAGNDRNGQLLKRQSYSPLLLNRLEIEDHFEHTVARSLFVVFVGSIV